MFALRALCIFLTRISLASVKSKVFCILQVSLISSRPPYNTMFFTNAQFSLLFNEKLFELTVVFCTDTFTLLFTEDVQNHLSKFQIHNWEAATSK